MGIIDKVVNWVVDIANDNTHGYDQTNRWGPDYDCSSLLISAWEQAGVPVKTKGAYNTLTMRDAFLSCGFEDVTGYVNRDTGYGMLRGDVLLNIINHCAMVVENNAKTIVAASQNEFGGIIGGRVGDQNGKEIYTHGYYNFPWDCVLRYAKDKPKEEGRRVAVFIGRTTMSTWYVRVAAGKENAKIKEFPTLKKGMVVYVMDYDQYDNLGQKWYYVKVQHPTLQWVYGFVLSTGIQQIKKL